MLSVEDLAVSTIYLVPVLREFLVYKDQMPHSRDWAPALSSPVPPQVPFYPPVGTLACLPRSSIQMMLRKSVAQGMANGWITVDAGLLLIRDCLF